VTRCAEKNRHSNLQYPEFWSDCGVQTGAIERAGRGRTSDRKGPINAGAPCPHFPVSPSHGPHAGFSMQMNTDEFRSPTGGDLIIDFVSNETIQCAACSTRRSTLELVVCYWFVRTSVVMLHN
jgi:hypothetical protein